MSKEKNRNPRKSNMKPSGHRGFFEADLNYQRRGLQALIMRKRSREIAMEIVYQSTINDNDPKELVEDYFEEYGESEEADRVYISMIVSGVMEKREELDALIEANLVKWKLSRVSKINLSILRVALYEMKYVEDIPNNVSINEAVEISKKYSDEQSAAFINGILDKIVKA
jgi:N utilization substance protein B